DHMEICGCVRSHGARAKADHRESLSLSAAAQHIDDLPNIAGGVVIRQRLSHAFGNAAFNAVNGVAVKKLSLVCGSIFEHFLHTEKISADVDAFGALDVWRQDPCICQH